MTVPDTIAVGMDMDMDMSMAFGEVGWPAAAVEIGAVVGAARYISQAEGIGKFLLVLVERKESQSLHSTSLPSSFVIVISVFLPP